MQTPFIKKVKKILADVENVDVICWNEDKTMIQIRNQKIFEQKVLSKHFRHTRISSFIRQLNLYGFKKIRSAENRTFTHSLLQKGLGLDSIVNKKKKINRSSQDLGANDSIRLQNGIDKELEHSAKMPCRDIALQHRISQNIIQKKETQKQEKSLLCTRNIISAPQQFSSTVWFMPMSSFQNQIWKPNFLMSQQLQSINLNCNYFSSWC